MSRYYDIWPAYVPVAERRREAERTVARLRKSGRAMDPVTIAGRAIATTFWGKAWCDNMESYLDYATRLPRGRSYVRNGLVIDLQIAAGKITAMVSGSELYTVSITIKETAAAQWRAICEDCAGGIDSLVELLQGRLSAKVMERLCRQENGLFPRPADIRFKCSCPDHAYMCKHVAAVLYGVGARLDQKPDLLFRLRAVDEAGLIASIDMSGPLAKHAPRAGRVLQTDDVSALFGLDMADAPGGVAEIAAPAGKTVKKTAAARRRAAGKVLAKKPAKPGALASKKVSAGAGKAKDAAPPKPPHSAIRIPRVRATRSAEDVLAKAKAAAGKRRGVSAAKPKNRPGGGEVKQKPVKWW